MCSQGLVWIGLGVLKGFGDTDTELEATVKRCLDDNGIAAFRSNAALEPPTETANAGHYF